MVGNRVYLDVYINCSLNLREKQLPNKHRHVKQTQGCMTKSVLSPGEFNIWYDIPEIQPINCYIFINP